MQLCGLARLHHALQSQWGGRHPALQVLGVFSSAAPALDGAGLSAVFAQQVKLKHFPFLTITILSSGRQRLEAFLGPAVMEL